MKASTFLSGFALATACSFSALAGEPTENAQAESGDRIRDAAENRSKYEIRPDWFVGSDVCYECYEENRAKFRALLEDFKAVQREGEGSESLSRYSVDDAFFVSQTGYLIHEECLDEERQYSFDIERTLIDTLVQVFDKLLALEESVEAVHRNGNTLSEREKKKFQLPTTIVKSHIPRLLHLFDRTSWDNSTGRLSSTFLFKNENGEEEPRITRSQDPCREFTAIFDTFDSVDNELCMFNPKVEQNRPKLFCAPDVLASENPEFESYFGYGANPNKPIPEVKEKDSLVHLYGGNNVVIKTDGISENGFRTLFTHEMFHNLGYYDPRKGQVPYPDICVGAIFSEDLALTRSQIARSEDDCFRGDYYRDIEDTASFVTKAMHSIY